MEHKLKEGTAIQHAGREWLITEVAEDNEGQIVYHLKSGEDVDVLRETDLPKDLDTMVK